MKTYIIAEAGVNHNGDKNLAYKLIDKACEAGVDCIKFQTFKAENLVSKGTELADYQKNNLHSSDTKQIEMLKKLELSYHDFAELRDYAISKGLDFCSTAFDSDSVEFLNTIAMPFWKIPSGEVTNLPLIIQIAKLNKPIIMSTGMCTLSEIQFILDQIRKYNNQNIILLHCNTEYPTPYEDVNLKAMLTLKETFNVDVGYSDHTLGIEVSLAAVALGAKVIEKHFTLDKSMDGPDHVASLDPDELKSMVAGIRHIEKSLGVNEKKVSHSEFKNKEVARKSIVAKKDIKKGEVLTEENLTTKRPGTGISPMKWYDVLGQVAKRDYQKDELIKL
ncbi:N-acetylneuraminate synthase [Candidatus Stoquefichus sp. SB1]|uniref:N-acetylneuraminate synthase n=1 Tax=Candidatus Stoquefichus sp. SB1 TaxID=1658109 RepID=UPI00067E6B81|nr:N-acetylneuraminate synthase [Candidatus Stoquefichus sp. SB1]